MSKELKDIAQELKNTNKKVQLIYAFNGTGKTRLSLEFKNLVAPKNITDADNGEKNQPREKILYYNAFTEDLFYWDNDLKAETNPAPKLKIQPNTFTDWLITLLRELGEDGNIISNFQRYTSSKVTPEFNEAYQDKIIDRAEKEIEITVPAYSEVTFKIAANQPVMVDNSVVTTNDGAIVVQGNYEIVKISKGEESNFVWSVIYTLLEQVISIRNEPDATNRITDKFDQLEYVFIDDPVSSLDDTHLIELAVDLATLIKNSAYIKGNGLRFVIATHNPLFYNVLYNELHNDLKNPINNGTPKWIYKRGDAEYYRLDKKADSTFELASSNDHPFSYHLFLLSEIRKAIETGQVKKYHFGFLRNILEKTATFLGYRHWEDLLEKTAEGHPNRFASRIINLSSHSVHAGEEITDIGDSDKDKLDELIKYLITTYGFRKQEQHG